MFLGIILLLGLFIHIYIPLIWVPLLYLGPLAIYILAKQYWTVAIWFFIIVMVLQQTSITVWWHNALYYALWILGVYIASLFLDRGWAVQGILATVFLVMSNIIITGIPQDYLNLAIYTMINGLAITIFLYIADKYHMYEELN
jgi:hypothetical protein